MNFCTSKIECLQDAYAGVSNWDYDRAAMAFEAVLCYENTERFRSQFAQVLQLMSWDASSDARESADSIMTDVVCAVMTVAEARRTTRERFDNQREF